MALVITIVTPERALPPFEAEHLTLPAADGEVGIRPGHAPLAAQLKDGLVLVRHQGRDRDLAIRAGVAQVLKDQVRLFVDAAADGDQLDVEPLRSAHARAQGAEAAWIALQLKAVERKVGRV